MFRILILHIAVAAAAATPIYPGGVSYGGIGTSTVSVSRRTVIAPGIYGGGVVPGMGVGTVVSSVYGTGTVGMAPLVDEKSASKVDGKREPSDPSDAVVKQVDPDVEVVKGVEGASPMGQLRTGSSRGRARKTNSQAPVKESQISTPTVSTPSPSTVQKRSSGV